MGHRLQKHLGPLGTINAGQYAVDETSQTARCVFVSCPGCGGIEDVSVDYDIGPGGEVTPRFECQTATCSYRDFLELGCWNEEPRS